MTFSQPSRIWWDSSQPGAGTDALSDATPSAGPPASTDEDTGIVGRSQDKRVICARSGFSVPYSETVIDPITGNRVWARFADKEDPARDDIPPLSGPPVRAGDI